MEWIEFTGDLEHYGWYIVCTNKDQVFEAHWTSNKWASTERGRKPRWERFGRIEHGITHYMPLPKPPKREASQ